MVITAVAYNILAPRMFSHVHILKIGVSIDVQGRRVSGPIVALKCPK
jgi:hypothetical protein